VKKLRSDEHDSLALSRESITYLSQARAQAQFTKNDSLLNKLVCISINKHFSVYYASISFVKTLYRIQGAP
jgi:hypothetical protein